MRLAGRETHMLNVVEVGGTILGAVAGDVVHAHREGARMAKPYCEIDAASTDCVIVSAPLPVSSSLYQASKLVPPAGILLREGGTVIVAAQCPNGTGPLRIVNEKIFELGVRRYLPARYELLLVSSMEETTVRQTYAGWTPSVEAAVLRAQERCGGGTLDVIVMPDASDLVPRRRP